MAGFLLIVGLTGSLLAFNFELERAFAPELFARPRGAGPPLDLATLAERAQQAVPAGRVVSVSLVQPDQASVWFEPKTATGAPRAEALGFEEFFQDPWTGNELGTRTGANPLQGARYVMPFIYSVHWTLALGNAGQWILGSVALLWTLDCFVAFYLTFPRTATAFWSRWWRAWKIKRTANPVRLNFDLHRAGGLWPWLLCIVFAWSSVMMNIRPVYESVMTRVFDYQSDAALYQPRPQPRYAPRLEWRSAQDRGRELIAEQARARGFVAGEPLTLSYFAEIGAYVYEVRGSHDLFDRAPKGGSTFVMFDGDTGALRTVSEPTGEHAGNTIESWLYALHMARVFGLGYQIFVCLLGLVVALLSVTGVYIWYKKSFPRLSARPAPT
jgi:uncharacterized iron-regulated membrane protein